LPDGCDGSIPDEFTGRTGFYSLHGSRQLKFQLPPVVTVPVPNRKKNGFGIAGAKRPNEKAMRREVFTVSMDEPGDALIMWDYRDQGLPSGGGITEVPLV